MAIGLGLDRHLGDMAKLMALKKDEICAKVLAVDGFDYSAVPQFLGLDVKLQ